MDNNIKKQIIFEMKLNSYKDYIIKESIKDIETIEKSIRCVCERLKKWQKRKQQEKAQRS